MGESIARMMGTMDNHDDIIMKNFFTRLVRGCMIGLDWIGLDWIGLDWIGLDWIGLDWGD